MKKIINTQQIEISTGGTFLGRILNGRRMTPQGLKILVLIMLTIGSQSTLHAWRKKISVNQSSETSLRRHNYHEVLGKSTGSLLVMIYCLIFMCCPNSCIEKIGHWISQLSFMSMFVSASIPALALLLTKYSGEELFNEKIEIAISLLATAFNILITTEIKTLIDYPQEIEENLASSCSLFQIKIGTAFAILHLSEYLGEILSYTKFFEERLLLHMFIGFTLVRFIIQIQICKQRSATYSANVNKPKQCQNFFKAIIPLMLSLSILLIISLEIYNTDINIAKALQELLNSSQLSSNADESSVDTENTQIFQMSKEQYMLMLSVFGLATYMTLNEIKKISKKVKALQCNRWIFLLQLAATFTLMYISSDEKHIMILIIGQPILINILPELDTFMHNNAFFNNHFMLFMSLGTLIESIPALVPKHAEITGSRLIRLILFTVAFSLLKLHSKCASKINMKMKNIKCFNPVC